MTAAAWIALFGLAYLVSTMWAPVYLRYPHRKG